ncbi:TPA: nitroreductase family protein [Legionella bozemanae]|uniref:nitroreductase family protein n=1 Tax=Legionella bozemanae TaxID=447 RepID=UPI00399CEA1F
MVSSEANDNNKIPMDLMDAIYTRHAVRDYLGKKVDASVINILLDAAIHAPTALHEEPRAFAVIQNKKILDRLSDSTKGLLLIESIESESQQRKHILDVVNQKEFNVFYNASTLIVIYSSFNGPFVTADCWLAAENLMLSALAYGLASCPIGFAVSALNLPEWKSELKIPEDMTAIAPIIIGWPAGNTLPSAHKSPTILTWK